MLLLLLLLYCCSFFVVSLFSGSIVHSVRPKLCTYITSITSNVWHENSSKRVKFIILKEHFIVHRSTCKKGIWKPEDMDNVFYRVTINNSIKIWYFVSFFEKEIDSWNYWKQSETKKSFTLLCITSIITSKKDFPLQIEFWRLKVRPPPYNSIINTCQEILKKKVKNAQQFQFFFLLIWKCYGSCIQIGIRKMDKHFEIQWIGGTNIRWYSHQWYKKRNCEIFHGPSSI